MADKPEGPDALLQRTGGQVICLMNEGNTKTSREGEHVVLDQGGGYAYKVFKKKEKADTRLDAFRKAHGADVNTPSAEVMAAKERKKQRQFTDVWLLKSTLVRGQSFQLSKPGHTTRLVEFARQSKDVGVIQRTIDELRKAYDFGLTDPQGFFDGMQSRPVTFIDIHRNRTGKGAYGLKEVFESLEEILEKMGGK